MNTWTGSDKHITQAVQSLLKAREVKANKLLLKQQQYLLAPNICTYCRNPLEYDKRKNKFCSRSCSATYNNLLSTHSDSTKQKLSDSLIHQYRLGRPTNKGMGQLIVKNCVVCGTEFAVTLTNKLKRSCCSIKCRKIRYTANGIANAANIMKRSKNEILFATLCKEAGFSIITNEPVFNGWDADVIIPDHKIAVLWNGKWHYEKITKKHSLLQVQNRDNIKVDAIIKAGYTPYIIKDMGSYNIKFVKKEFEKFLGWFGEMVSQDFHTVKS